MIRKIIVSAILLMTLASVAATTPRPSEGPKVDGKWVGQIPRPNQSYDAVFSFKASGEKLTGTVNAIDQEFEINDGKIKGDSVSFKIGSTAGTYSGKVSGDEIAMKVNLSGGEFGSRVMDFTLKRVKE
jgi:hypothetical protein